MNDNTYIGSEEHIANANMARLKALESHKKLKLERIAAYDLDPTVCKECEAPINYEKRNNKFCSKSCAGRYNNPKKGNHTEETKIKISKGLQKYHDAKPESVKKVRVGSFCKIHELICKVCSKKKLVSSREKDRKTCGKRECRIYASTKSRTYQNGSRKPVWYFNPYEDKDVLLDSSWEVKVADRLIVLGIEWTRPEPILWYDDEGKSHLYYPDFYLKEHDIYLDPKNPYCMEKDKVKMKKISDIVTLKYGSLEYILEYIEKVQF